MSWLTRLLGRGKRGERRSHPSVHPRDPVLAKWWGLSANTIPGVAVTPETALACPAVDACVGLLADTVGTIPLDLFERTGDGARERRPDEPLHALMHEQPNEWMTSAEFRQLQMTNLCTHGNGYARIDLKGGLPDQLVPLEPWRTTPFRDPRGRPAYRYARSDGGFDTLLGDEVLHLKRRPFTADGLMGQSPVVRHKETIGLALACSQYLARFFANDTVPPAYLKVPVVLDEEAEAALLKKRDRQKGLERKHEMQVIDGGMEIETLGTSARDAQLVETYKNLTAEIARIFGVPLHLIGETDKDSNWGTGIEQQSIGFIVYFVRPWLVVWEQALNRALMSRAMRRRFFYEFNADGLLRGDFKTRMEGYALMIQWALASPNEVRRLMNLAPVDGGDDRLQPLNMAPASKVLEVLMKDSGAAQRALDDLHAARPRLAA